MALAATLPAAAEQSKPEIVRQSAGAERWKEEQRTNEILNTPRPGDRIMKSSPGDEDYYYYDGGRWNKHRDIWRNGNEAEEDRGNDPGLFDGYD